MELYKVQRRIKGVAIIFGLWNIVLITLWSIILFEVFLPKGHHQLNSSTEFPHDVLTPRTRTVNSKPSSLSTTMSTTVQTTIPIETTSSTSTTENTITEKVSSTTESAKTTVETTVITTLAGETENSSPEPETTTMVISTPDIPISEKDLTTEEIEDETTEKNEDLEFETEKEQSTTEAKKENSDEDMQSDQGVTDTSIPVISIPFVEKKSLKDIIEEKIENEDGTSFHQVVFEPTTKQTTTESTTTVQVEAEQQSTTIADIEKTTEKTTFTTETIDPIVELEKDSDSYNNPEPRSRKSELGSPPQLNQNLNRNLYEDPYPDPNIEATRYFEEKIRQERQDDPEAEFETSYHQMYKRSIDISSSSRLFQCSSTKNKFALSSVSIWSIVFGLLNAISSVLLFKGGKRKSYYKTQISLYLTSLTMVMSVCSIIYLILVCGSEFPPNNKLFNQPGRLGLGINIFNLLISVIEVFANYLFLQTLTKIYPIVSLTQATHIQLAKL